VTHLDHAHRPHTDPTGRRKPGASSWNGATWHARVWVHHKGVGPSPAWPARWWYPAQGLLSPPAACYFCMRPSAHEHTPGGALTCLASAIVVPSGIQGCVCTTRVWGPHLLGTRDGGVPQAWGPSPAWRARWWCTPGRL